MVKYGVTIILVIIIGRLIQLRVHEIIIYRRNIHQSLIRPIWVIWNSSLAPQAKFLSCAMQKSFRKRISCGTKPQNFRLRRKKKSWPFLETRSLQTSDLATSSCHVLQTTNRSVSALIEHHDWQIWSDAPHNLCITAWRPKRPDSGHLLS